MNDERDEHLNQGERRRVDDDADGEEHHEQMVGSDQHRIPLVLNMLVLACFIPAYLPDAYEVLYLGVIEEELWSELFYTVPTAYVALYSLLAFLICGLWSLVVSGLSYFIDNRVVLLAAPSLFWLAVDFLNTRIFLALGALNGFQLDIADNMRAGVESYAQDGRIIAVECILMLVCALLLIRRGSRGDAL